MILNTLDHLGKFEAKGDEGYFIGYSMSSKAFRVFNTRTKRVEENLHVDFLKNKLIEKGAGPNWLFDIDTLTNSMNYVPVVSAGTTSTNFLGTKEAASQYVKKDVSSLRYITLPNWFHEAHLETSTSNAQDACKADAPESSGNSNPTATSTNLPADQMATLTVETLIPTISSPIPTACLDDSPQLSNDTRLISKRVTSQDDTPSLDNILTLSNRFEDIFGVTTNICDTNGVEANLSNMENNISARVRPISTKWVLKNKKDDRGIVIRNKARPVAQGHTQEEGINYKEVFAPVARIEAIRLFLAYATFMGFTVYQMDVKSAFLYGTIDEEVYVMQPPGFQDLEFPARMDVKSAFLYERIEEEIRALVDGKKIIVTEASIRRDLQLQDAEGTAWLPNDTIFEELARMGAKTTAWNEFSSIMASAIICLANNQKFNFSMYIFDNMVFANMKREEKSFSGIITPLFETMMVQAPEEMGEGSEKRVKKLERKKKLRSLGLKRLWKVGSTTRVESSKDKESLGDQEDASKQGRMINNIDQDVEITLVDETQRRMNEEDMFGVNDLDVMSTADPVTTTGELVTTVEDVEVTTAATTLQISKDELTLAQTLIEIKAAKPKARGVIVQPKAEWDDVQVMIDADHELAERLQAKEQGELTIKEMSKLFVELMNERKKNFARLRAEEKRRKPPTKTQKKDNKLDEQVEAENDQREAEMKMYMKIMPDDEIAFIPLATKPPIIVDWKVIKEEKISSYHLIRADGSSKRYSSMI
nr:putative ribonuclease H-like domain-containing protein [Tanacetum cinerariifolium]